MKMNKLEIHQQALIVSECCEIFMQLNTRNDTIEKLLKIVISEAIYLKRYDALQRLCNQNLI